MRFWYAYLFIIFAVLDIINRLETFFIKNTFQYIDHLYP